MKYDKISNFFAPKRKTLESSVPDGRKGLWASRMERSVALSWSGSVVRYSRIFCAICFKSDSNASKSESCCSASWVSTVLGAIVRNSVCVCVFELKKMKKRREVVWRKNKRVFLGLRFWILNCMKHRFEVEKCISNGFNCKLNQLNYTYRSFN